MRRGVLVVLALCAVACGSTPDGPDYEAARNAPPVLTGSDLERFNAALDDLENGRTEPARDELRLLAGRRREDFILQRWLQESELAVARERAFFLEQTGVEEGIDPLRDLREHYRERAEETGEATDLLLAARLEDDPPAALHLVDRALAADPNESWAWLGRAHISVRLGQWKAARESLNRCLELDPGNLVALRLSAWVQAEAGSRKAAISELERWLMLAETDPTIGRAELDAARLDLALLLVQEGDPEFAEEILLKLEGSNVDPVRRLTALAAVRQARGEPMLALQSTELARKADPEALLPVVQEALLVERHFDDPHRALEAWRLALELSRKQKDLGAVLQRTRAEVHIGRLERQLGIDGEHE